MAKRTATTQLTHDNWEDEDEEVEEPGQCPIASPVALQNRIIRRARRSREPSDGETVKSPFMGFSGFAKAPPQSFVWNSPADTMSDVFRKRKQNGCGETEKPKSASEFNSDESTAKKMCISKESKIESKDLDHFRHLQKLNESVLDWMQKHMAKNPYCDFTPVFNDYKNHLVTLERKYPVQKQSTSALSIAKKNNDNPFKMPGLITGKSSSFLADTSADSIAKSGFSKFMKNNDSTEAKDDSDREMDYGAGFKSNTTNTSTISFGIKGRALTETSSGSPLGPSISHSSGKKEHDEDENADEKVEVEKEKSTSTFKFGFKTNFGSSPFEKLDSKKSGTEPFRFSTGVTDPKTFSFGGGASTSSTATDKSKDDEEYVPPKNEVSAVVEEDALYSKRCKLFFKKDDTFADRGVGTLYLKSLDGKTQLLVRADTNLGNILLNIRLSSTIPVQRTGKNNVLIVCVPNPCIDPKKPDSKEAIPMLIRVKTTSDADELFEALNKHKS